MRTSPALLIPLVLSLGLAVGPSGASTPRAVSAASEEASPTIAQERVMDMVRFLAAPARQGRQSGSPGYDRAAAWATVEMRRAGLEPGAPGGEWLLPLSVEANDIERCRLGVHGDDPGPGGEGEPAGAETGWLKWGDDFVCRGFTGSGRVQAPVVFVGYGFSRPELGYDDYAGVDVKDAIVLAFKGKPKWSPETGDWVGDHLPRRRAAVAREHGARGLLLVNTPGEWQTAPIGSVLHGPGEHEGEMPQAHVAIDVAERILRLDEGALGALRAEIDEAREPRSGREGRSVLMDVEATYRESARTANVVGVLPAADSESADEYVVVGAHLDHVGPQGDGHLFPGANDNASGAAAVVAVAEALAAREAPPQRNVVFVLFAAEEQGLHGSKAFVESGVVPPEKIVAMVNLDCVGYGERLRMGGGKSAPKLWELARTLDREAEGITVEDTWWGGGADAQAFFEQGIPTLYLATKDSYAHLHQPTDTPDTLNGTLLGAVARHTYRVVSAVADGGYAREALQPRPSRN